jgi:hypothetical protein
MNNTTMKYTGAGKFSIDALVTARRK